MLVEIAITSFVLWSVWFILTYLERRNLPPGIFPYPWIGNLPFVMMNPVKPLSILKQKYGDIFTMSFFHSNMIVLNTASLAREARITRKDDIAGLSPQSIYPKNIIIGGNDLIFADYNAAYLFRRRVFKLGMHVFGSGLEQAQQHVGHAVHSALHHIESLNAKPFSPKDITSTAIIIQLWEWLTSKKLQFHDKTIRNLFEFRDILIKQTWQGSLYKLIPFQSYLPTQFNRDIRRAQNIISTIFQTEFRNHMETYSPGNVRDMTDSFISAYKKEISKETGKDIGSIDDVTGLMLDVAIGGSDTTSATITWFILFMVCYPEVQERIHRELDEVIGKDRTPQWPDSTETHYLQATICEVLRRSSPVPATRAGAVRDTALGGYKIPKGSSVLFNIREIHLDDRQWPEPHAFKPERFLDSDGKFVGWKTFPAFLPFNLGRRDCAGASFAKIMIFTFTATLLHRFHIVLPEGAELPSMEISSAQIVSCPMDFHVVAKLRRKKIA